VFELLTSAITAKAATLMRAADGSDSEKQLALRLVSRVACAGVGPACACVDVDDDHLFDDICGAKRTKKKQTCRVKPQRRRLQFTVYCLLFPIDRPVLLT
jgi:hypothetical protein